METSFKVRLHSIEERRNTARVTWWVETLRFRESFSEIELAKGFHGQLDAAKRKGEAFRLSDGLPVSMARKTKACTWITFAKSYVEFRWNDSSPGHRRNIVEALTSATIGMLSTNRGKPDDRLFAAAMRFMLNLKTRDQEPPENFRETIRWIEQNTRQVADISQPKVLLGVLGKIGEKQDGTKAAASTTRRKRMTLTNALDYAVICEFLTVNPLPHLKAAKPKKGKHIRPIDRRVVANPIQVGTLLYHVRQTGKAGPRLVAYFGSMVYAGLRPEEAACLSKDDLALPKVGWGDLHIHEAAPEVGKDWTDSGLHAEKRELKHREPGEVRIVPCPPELTALLWWHLETFGTAPDGRLFRGARDGGRIGSTVYGRAWANVRDLAFTPEVAASPLVRRPYDLRHTWVSTLLAAGVDPPLIAEWAGHSLRVLMEIYAQVLDGSRIAAQHKIDALFGRKVGGQMGDEHPPAAA